MAATLGEFERIARFFAPLAAPEALSLLDDVALIPGPPGEQYVLKTDAIVENVHFLSDDPAAQIAQKLLRVNLSDLAGKGARPFGYLLTTALPRSRDDQWLAEFASGLAADQKEFGIGLLGGDSVATAEGAMTLSVAAIGRIAAGRCLLRSGAKIGEAVFVSGTLGDAALGVLAAKGEAPDVMGAERDFLIGRFRLPRPRLNLGSRLIGLASASMDISDGLVADLGHICEASGVAAEIEAARVPLSPAIERALARDPARIQLVLSGGDDYELLFTAPAAAEPRLAEASREAGVPVTRIGAIVAGKGVRVRGKDGAEIAVPHPGYVHF
jgi:thiamine-monophosphate kinase